MNGGIGGARLGSFFGYLVDHFIFQKTNMAGGPPKTKCRDVGAKGMEGTPSSYSKCTTPLQSWAHLERELIWNRKRTGTGTEKSQFPFLGSRVPSRTGTDLERTGTDLERIFWPSSVGSNYCYTLNTHYFNTKFG